MTSILDGFVRHCVAVAVDRVVFVRVEAPFFSRYFVYFGSGCYQRFYVFLMASFVFEHRVVRVRIMLIVCS